jgi:hypothetical protein
LNEFSLVEDPFIVVQKNEDKTVERLLIAYLPNSISSFGLHLKASCVQILNILPPVSYAGITNHYVNNNKPSKLLQVLRFWYQGICPYPGQLLLNLQSLELGFLLNVKKKKREFFYFF